MASAPAGREHKKKSIADSLFGEGTGLTKFEEQLVDVVVTKLDILITKRKQRGTANIQRQGLMGVVNRLSEDKLERVKRMVEDDALAHMLHDRGLEVFHSGTDLPGMPAMLINTEQRLQLEDDLMDIANYCDIAILMLRNSWE